MDKKVRRLHKQRGSRLHSGADLIDAYEKAKKVGYQGECSWKAIAEWVYPDTFGENLTPESYVSLVSLHEFKPRKPSKGKKSGFYRSQQWRQLRYEALKKFGRKCVCCGASPKTGAVMHVDHIKPVSKFPHLALVLNNLQILCEDCNLGKVNFDCIDWTKE